MPGKFSAMVRTYRPITIFLHRIDLAIFTAIFEKSLPDILFSVDSDHMVHQYAFAESSSPAKHLSFLTIRNTFRISNGTL